MKIIDWLFGSRCAACGRRSRTRRHADQSAGAGRFLCGGCHEKGEAERRERAEQKRREEERIRKDEAAKAARDTERPSQALEGGRALPEPAPVLVRCDLWKNTGVNPQELAPKPKPGPTSDVRELVQRLKHTDGTVRRVAAEGLGRIGPRASEAVPALVVALIDINREIRLAAKEALRTIDHAWQQHDQIASAVAVLVEHLGSRRSETCQAAAEVLGQLGSPAVTALSQALQAPESVPRRDTRRLWAARALGWIGPPARAAIPALVQTLSAEESYVIEAAADALAKMGPAAQEAMSALIQTLGHWNPSVREAVACALGRAGAEAKAAVPALIELLAPQQERVRDVAAEALVQIGPPAAPALRRVLVDRIDAVRLAKERALKERPEGVLSLFYQELANRDGPVRQLAAKVLSRIESATPDVCPPAAHDEPGEGDARFQCAKAEAEQEIVNEVVPRLLKLWRVEELRETARRAPGAFLSFYRMLGEEFDRAVDVIKSQKARRMLKEWFDRMLDEEFDRAVYIIKNQEACRMLNEEFDRAVDVLVTRKLLEKIALAAGLKTFA
jgi:HEAT repeat protein